ncbi:hypothetical protein CR513_08869, partial [Mucuna pruriens]
MFNTWGDMKRMFLEKFFPASRTAALPKEIFGIWQHYKETLHEYWERLNKLYTTCLLMMDQNMVDAASWGALMDKTPAAARQLILNMARGVDPSRVVNKVGAFDNLRLENQLTELASLMRQLVVEQHQKMWNMHLSGAPYRYVPHFIGNRVKKHIMH